MLELLGLLNKKRDWFIQAEVAALYFESGESDKAMEFALAAVSNFGDLEYKIGLIVLIADILAQKGDDIRAFKHYELSRLLREQEKWSIPSGLMGKIKRYEFPSITAEGLPQLIRELKAFWSRSLPAEKSQGSPSSRQRGTIRRLLHNDSKGIDGFIRSGKEDLYFTIRYDPLISERILVGSIVEFEKKLSVQHNKMNAVNVRICK